MNDLNQLGKLLLFIGGIIILAGGILLLLGKLPISDKIPGNFSWKGKNWSVYFPLGTSILLSIILSLILFLIRKFKG